MPTHPSKPTLFATTRWTLVIDAARGGGESAAMEALGTLFQTYWQPLYRYARRNHKSREDAEDLVQGFLAHLLENHSLENVDRAKGRFRTFLLAAFNHWLINDWKHATRQKRGGGVAPLSFDWESAETGLKLEIADERSPDRLFDREWALALLGNVLAELERACRAEGHAAQFEILKPCLTADSSRIPYAELAARLDMTEGAARVAAHRLRKRYRALLTEAISRTLS
ncbi:MAG: sigma-70 family RNA polymerase sigma factor, partial [Akkermansiaceae bacterium]|nr:sigma-70 family RNA polymerase sigma factor [Akkermansiaceae bacterium]